MNNNEIEEIPYVLFYQKCDRNKQYIEKKNDNKIYTYTKKIYTNKIYDNNNGDNLITLNFNYDDKQFYFDVNKNSKIQDLINALNKKYNVSRDIKLYFQTDKDFKPLEENKMINYYGLKDQSTLTVLDITY